jgi:hypothetical protein
MSYVCLVVVLYQEDVVLTALPEDVEQAEVVLWRIDGLLRCQARAGVDVVPAVVDRKAASLEGGLTHQPDWYSLRRVLDLAGSQIFSI